MRHTPGPSPCCQAGSSPYGDVQELASAESAPPIWELVCHGTPPTHQRTSVLHPLPEGEGIGASLRTSTAHLHRGPRDRKSTRLNSSHLVISYAVFCLKK